MSGTPHQDPSVGSDVVRENEIDISGQNMVLTATVREEGNSTKGSLPVATFFDLLPQINSDVQPGGILNEGSRETTGGFVGGRSEIEIASDAGKLPAAYYDQPRSGDVKEDEPCNKLVAQRETIDGLVARLRGKVEDGPTEARDSIVEKEVEDVEDNSGGVSRIWLAGVLEETSGEDSGSSTEYQARKRPRRPKGQTKGKTGKVVRKRK